MASTDPWSRPLTDAEQRTVADARHRAWVLYEGVHTPHRSCGIALAETFGLPTRPYQSLRRGGLSGLGSCGSAMGARLVLGELLGDPDPSGATTPALKAAMAWFDRELPQRVDRMGADSWICNDLTARFPEFRGPARAAFCTRLATEAATLVAEGLIRAGHPLAIEPLHPTLTGEPQMPVLPDGLQASRSVAFDETSLPAGLRREHTTRAGVWATVEVLEGRLWYRIREGLGGCFLLGPDRHGVIEPTVPHEVEPDGPVQLRITFYPEAPAPASH